MSILDFFKDKQGNFVIGQWPNKPLILALGLYVLRYIPNSLAQHISHWGVSIVLIYWAFLEITAGVNSWRRLLGLLVMLSSITNLLRLIAPSIFAP
jgi:hypothetical protein